MKILKAYNIPIRLLAAINIMNQKTRARIITPDGETKYVEINAGVLQGYTLAPYLFVIVLDYITWEKHLIAMIINKREKV